MLRVEARNAETPIERKPEWIRTTAKMGPAYTELGGPRGDLPHRRRAVHAPV